MAPLAQSEVIAASAPNKHYSGADLDVTTRVTNEIAACSCSRFPNPHSMIASKQQFVRWQKRRQLTSQKVLKYGEID